MTNRLKELISRHRELDRRIRRESASPAAAQGLALIQLKRLRLRLKDQIRRLRHQSETAGA